MENNRSYYTNFLTMLSGNSISQIIPFFIAPILSRIYSPKEYAVFATYTAIILMMGSVATGRLELAIPIAKEKQTARNIVYTGLLITLTITLISTVFPVFSEQVADFYNDAEIASHLWTIPIGVASIGLYGVLSNWLLRHKKYTVLSAGKVVLAITNHGLAAFLGYLGWGVDGLIFGWLSGQLVSILMLSLFVDKTVEWKQYSFSVAKKTVKEFKDFPLINSLHAFTDNLAMQVVLFWIISSFFGLHELGLFAMMNKYVRAPMNLISGSVSGLFYAEAADAKNNERSLMPIAKKTLSISSLFSIPFTIVVILAGPTLFSWYLGEEWREAGVYAQYMAFVLLCNFLISPVSGITIIFNEQKKAYIFAVIGYAVSLSGLAAISLLGWEFKYALLIYGGIFGLYYLSLLVWYFKMIKSHHESLN